MDKISHLTQNGKLTYDYRNGLKFLNINVLTNSQKIEHIFQSGKMNNKN